MDFRELEAEAVSTRLGWEDLPGQAHFDDLMLGDRIPAAARPHVYDYRGIPKVVDPHHRHLVKFQNPCSSPFVVPIKNHHGRFVNDDGLVESPIQQLLDPLIQICRNDILVASERVTLNEVDIDVLLNHYFRRCKQALKGD